MLDFEHSLPMLLLRAREATMVNFRPILSEHGLTEQQWRVLRILWEENGLETKDLTDRALMLRPSMTGVIDRMERDGLVERRKNRTDGRKITIHMTSKAKRLFKKITPLVEAKYSELQDRVTERKWNGLYESLHHLASLNDEQNNK